MKKIPTLFKRDWNGDRSRVLAEIHEDCNWVVAGEGWPTRKLDGTSCLVREGRLYKRRELRKDDKTPENFEAVENDAETGKIVGWVLVGNGPEDRWHREAFSRSSTFDPGTYELVGPKIQGNPEQYAQHELVPHSAVELECGRDVLRTFDGLRAWLTTQDIEGIVFHHSDGRMAKIKLRDFGFKRGERK